MVGKKVRGKLAEIEPISETLEAVAVSNVVPQLMDKSVQIAANLAEL